MTREQCIQMGLMFFVVAAMVFVNWCLGKID
jgi:hypothetical protein